MPDDHRRAGCLADDLLGGTAEIDVDQVGTTLDRQNRRICHDLGVRARQLDADGTGVAIKQHPLGGLPRIEQHLPAGDHLRDHEPDTKTLRQAPKRLVAHTRHRGEKDPIGNPDGPDIQGF